VARLIERADWLDETVATLDSPIVTTGSGPEESPGDRRVPEQRSPRCDRTRLARGRGSGVVKPAPPSDGPRPRRREDGSLGPLVADPRPAPESRGVPNGTSAGAEARPARRNPLRPPRSGART
jgi:hypothetical protein